jgi:hypothetical protein
MYLDIAWVVNKCKICNSNTITVNKALITPILSKGPSYRIVVDLIDFRTSIDKSNSYIGHIRDAFS